MPVLRMAECASSSRCDRLIVGPDLGTEAFETADDALKTIKANRKRSANIRYWVPGMNGRQFADIELSQRPTLPLLFIAGYAENATRFGEYLTRQCI